ncbi:Abi-alpha family protein [Paradesulfitobacterium aromaticivorans]
MSDEIRDAAEVVKGIVEAVPVYEDLLHPAAQELGKGLQTVAKTINVVLAPVAALIWGYEQIKAYIQPALEKRLKNVPPEQIIPPDPAVAGPALEALRFTGYKEDLRELYANLLATSMDVETALKAHPAFVEILKQLSPDEARILGRFQEHIPIPILSMRSVDSRGYYTTLLHNFTTVAELAGCALPQLVTSYVDNLVRLGLAEISYERYSIDPGAYEAELAHPTVVGMKTYIENNERSVEIRQGVLERTNLGKQFYEACILPR